MKYRKKPVVIEAVRLGESPESLEQVVAFCASPSVFVDHDSENHSHLLSIHTLEGTMQARVGDWIIRGVKGELYPCKPDIFAATYDKVD